MMYFLTITPSYNIVENLIKKFESVCLVLNKKAVAIQCTTRLNEIRADESENIEENSSTSIRHCS